MLASFFFDFKSFCLWCRTAVPKVHLLPTSESWRADHSLIYSLETAAGKHYCIPLNSPSCRIGSELVIKKHRYTPCWKKRSHLSSKNFFHCQKIPKNFAYVSLQYPKSTNAWPSNFGLLYFSHFWDIDKCVDFKDLWVYFRFLRNWGCPLSDLWPADNLDHLRWGSNGFWIWNVATSSSKRPKRPFCSFVVQFFMRSPFQIGPTTFQSKKT